MEKTWEHGVRCRLADDIASGNQVWLFDGEILCCLFSNTSILQTKILKPTGNYKRFLFTAIPLFVIVFSIAGDKSRS